MRTKFPLFAVSVLFVMQIAIAPQANAFFRLEQLVKDTVDGELATINNNPKYQRLSCDDITGDIERVVVSLSHQSVSPSFNPYSNYTLEFQGAINQTSEILHVTDTDGGQHDYVFMFSPPVNGANLCAGQSSVVMSIKDGQTSYLGRAKLHGSNFSNAYRDANFDCGFSCAIRDWYFIINPQPPVITLQGPSSLILEEGDVYVEQHATAIDLEDGNISASIVIGGDVVNTNVSGVYFVTYSVMDSHGIASQEVTRTVIVDVASQILEPLDLQVESQANPPRVGTSMPSFSATFYSPTSTTFAVAYEIQIATSSGNWVAPYYDSGMQSLTNSIASGVRSPQILGPIFAQDGRSYFWRIRFWDQDGNRGKWSADSNYYLIAIPPSASTDLLATQDVGINNGMAFGGNTTYALGQTIDCRAVQGQITDIALRGQGNGGLGLLNVYLTDEAGHESEVYEWPKYPAPIETHVFHFSSPILCESGMVMISVKGTGPQIVYFDGVGQDVFPWGECVGSCRLAKDLYFEIYGTSIATNNAPVLDPIGNRTVNEGELIEFTVNATDSDNDSLTYSANNLPLGASFNVSTGLFSWTPSYNQEGNYADIEFTVTDNGDPMELDTELIMISVGNVNRPPVFAGVGNQEALEGEMMSFVISATDPDGDSVSLIASGTPVGASFDTNTGLFTWTPTLAQAGAYIVQFIATDNGVPNLASLLEVPLTVGDNLTPTEQAAAVVNVVVDYNFPLNVENSYLANLKKVAKFIEEGKIAAARNQLLAFIDKVENDMTTGIIRQTEGNELLALANALLDDLQ